MIKINATFSVKYKLRDLFKTKYIKSLISKFRQKILGFSIYFIERNFIYFLNEIQTEYLY
jgi:hypothetical protein